MFLTAGVKDPACVTHTSLNSHFVTAGGAHVEEVTGERESYRWLRLGLSLYKATTAKVSQYQVL